MAYWFAGFFAIPALPPPSLLPEDAVWKDISVPFSGVGVRLPHLIGETPSPIQAASLATDLSLDIADCWLYLTYTCWGGRIDSVYGLGVSRSSQFGPISADENDKVEAAYTELMSQLGIPTAHALNFEPFHRGHWGEA